MMLVIRQEGLTAQETSVRRAPMLTEEAVQKACKTDILFPENGHDAEAGQADR